MDELEKAVERLKAEGATSEKIKEVIKKLVKETREKREKALIKRAFKGMYR